VNSLENAVPIHKTLSTLNLAVGIDHAVLNQEWVIVVFPDQDQAHEARRALPALLPSGTRGGGRTFMLPSGGRISVVCALDPLFVPQDKEYTVMFLGWSGASTTGYASMAAWRDRAASRIDLIQTRDVVRGA